MISANFRMPVALRFSGNTSVGGAATSINTSFKLSNTSKSHSNVTNLAFAPKTDRYMSSVQFTGRGQKSRQHAGEGRSAADPLSTRRQALNTQIKDRLDQGLPIDAPAIELLQREMLANDEELSSKAIHLTRRVLNETDQDVVLSNAHVRAIESAIQSGPGGVRANIGVKTYGVALEHGKITSIPGAILRLLGESIKPSHGEDTRTTAFQTIEQGIRSGIITSIPAEGKRDIIAGVSSSDRGLHGRAFGVLQAAIKHGLITVIPDNVQQALFPTLFHHLNSSPDQTFKNHMHTTMSEIADKGMISEPGLRRVYTELRNPNASWDSLRTTMRVLGNAYRSGTVQSAVPSDIQTIVSNYKNNDNSALRGSARGARNVLRSKHLWTKSD